jgi:hypothetical protein
LESRKNSACTPWCDFLGSPCPLEDVSLRNMKTGKIGAPRRIFIKADRQHEIGSGKHNPGLI